jgi:hypothetical protein
MKKATSLKEIFKNGDNFEFSKINYSSKYVCKDVAKIKMKQHKITEEYKVDLNELRKFTFDI